MRYRNYLRERYRFMLGYVGGVAVFIGLTMLSPLLLLPFYPEELRYAPGFLLIGVPLIVLGGGMWHEWSPRHPIGLTRQEGMVIVVLAWLVALFAGTVPFMFDSKMNFTQAFFESTSGWTSTGLTVVDVAQAPRLILMYRSVIELIGGAGFAIFMLSAISSIAGSGFTAAEGRDEQLVPHVQRSAGIVLRMYLGYNVLGILALIIAGMSVFDAVNHAFAAVATGGFSTRPESIGYWDDPLIEAIIIALMLVGSLNFFTAYRVMQGKWRAFTYSGEIQFLAILFPLAVGVLFLSVTSDLYEGFGRQVRVAVFESVAAFSTAGFSITTYRDWGDLGWLALAVLMNIGGGSGSTAGGIKQMRFYLFYQALKWEIQRFFQPASVIGMPYFWHADGEHPLEEGIFRRTGLFFFVYLSVFFVGSAGIMAHGYPMREAFLEFASALATAGLSGGVTQPDAPVGVLWIEIFGMLLGRLEFFALIVGGIKLVQDLRLLGGRKDR